MPLVETNLNLIMRLGRPKRDTLDAQFNSGEFKRKGLVLKNINNSLILNDYLHK